MKLYWLAGLALWAAMAVFCWLILSVRRKLGRPLLKLGSPVNPYALLVVPWVILLSLEIKIAVDFGLEQLDDFFPPVTVSCLLISSLVLFAHRKAVRAGGISSVRFAFAWQSIKAYCWTRIEKSPEFDYPLNRMRGDYVLTFSYLWRMLCFKKQTTENWIVPARIKDRIDAILREKLPGKETEPGVD